MKSLLLILASLFTLTTALSISAKEQSVLVNETTQTSQPACYLQEQRKSEFCQKLMFPPMPFR